VRLPKELNGGNIKLTIENSGGDRYSTPVTKSFVLQPR
jgi:virulence-associated protein VagC